MTINVVFNIVNFGCRSQFTISLNAIKLPRYRHIKQYTFDHKYVKMTMISITCMLNAPIRPISRALRPTHISLDKLLYNESS